MAYSKHTKYIPDEMLRQCMENKNTTSAFKTPCQYLTSSFLYIISLSYAAFATFRKVLRIFFLLPTKRSYQFENMMECKIAANSKMETGYSKFPFRDAYNLFLRTE